MEIHIRTTRDTRVTVVKKIIETQLPNFNVNINLWK